MASTVMEFTKLYMTNPNQKTILIEQTSKDIVEICKKFQEDSGVSDFEVKTLLEEIARLWEIEEKNKFGFR